MPRVASAERTRVALSTSNDFIERWLVGHKETKITRLRDVFLVPRLSSCETRWDSESPGYLTGCYILVSISLPSSQPFQSTN